MPGEVNRQSAAAATSRSGPQFLITVHGATVRVHLAGILDRAGVQRLLRQIAAHLGQRHRHIVLDGSRLVHLDYRCVVLLVRWSRALRGLGHRLTLSGWNGYLTAILAMEDWDGELEDGYRRTAPARLAAGSWRHVQAP